MHSSSESKFGLQGGKDTILGISNTDISFLFSYMQYPPLDDCPYTYRLKPQIYNKLREGFNKIKKKHCCYGIFHNG